MSDDVQPRWEVVPVSQLKTGDSILVDNLVRHVNEVELAERWDKYQVIHLSFLDNAVGYFNPPVDACVLALRKYTRD